MIGARLSLIRVSWSPRLAVHEQVPEGGLLRGAARLRAEELDRHG